MTSKRNPAPKLWANSTEAADLLGVHPSTLLSWREQRIGPAFNRHDNGAIRYRITDLEEYLTRTRYAGNPAQRAVAAQ